MATFAFQLEEEDLETLPRATARAATDQECVLLIEDSEEAMMLVRLALEEHGGGRYRLEWASSLSAGLDQLSNEDIDIVLLDLGLPESSGQESCAWVRQTAPRVPVVVLTGDDSEETEAAVTASGVSGYLVKEHVSGMRLLETIRGALVSPVQSRRTGSDKIRELRRPPLRIK